MVDFDGERFCNAKEAADLLHVSRPTFYKNVQRFLSTHELPARSRLHYRLAEVEKHKKIKTIGPKQMSLDIESVAMAS